MKRWFLPTRRGDARAAILMTIMWAALSVVVSVALPFGDGGWLGWVIAAPIFGVLMYIQLRRTHRRAADTGTDQ